MFRTEVYAEEQCKESNGRVGVWRFFSGDYDETAATNVTTTHHRPHFPRTLYSTCALFCAWRRWDASTTFKTHSVSHLTSDIINIHFYCRKKRCKVLFGDRKILTFELDWQFVRLTWWHQNMGLLQLDPEKWSHLLICWPKELKLSFGMVHVFACFCAPDVTYLLVIASVVVAHLSILLIFEIFVVFHRKFSVCSRNVTQFVVVVVDF